ncbi:hypothetical protein [Helicobacter heilmannii]|uniref:hypothetical protein n=1 Tax=Helicobacter heilmannii TaxID=35817 RepID=UPI0006A100D5|nr:hypothetical protein [Helicobacter heilmannii]CRF46353.1 hypothetical protein HHE014_13590 [Helicobacter heilmannii]
MAKLEQVEIEVRSRYGDIPTQLQNAREDLRTFKVTLLGELVGESNPTGQEIAALKTQMACIEKQQNDYGFDFQNRTFTTSRVFTPPLLMCITLCLRKAG